MQQPYPGQQYPTQPYPGQQYPTQQYPTQGQYTQPPVIVQPQPQVFVQAQQNVVRSKKWENYKSKSSVVLGVIQISIAVICIIANSVAFHLQRIREDFADDFNAENEAFYVLTGVWASFFFILTGSFAIVAARFKTSCWIVTTMVFAIISCLFAFALLGTMAGAVGIENSDYMTYDENKCPLYSGFGCYIPREGTSLDKTSLAFGAIMLILSMVEIVVSIWTSAICCASVCCGRRARAQMMSGGEAVQYASNPPAGQVMYVNQGAPVYPAQGQGNMHMYQPPQYTGPAMYQQPGQQYPTAPADHGPPNTGPVQPPAYGEVQKM